VRQNVPGLNIGMVGHVATAISGSLEVVVESALNQRTENRSPMILAGFWRQRHLESHGCVQSTRESKGRQLELLLSPAYYAVLRHLAIKI
jgi:hypothetical protein